MSFGNDLRKKLNTKLKDEVAFLISEDDLSFSEVKTWIPTGCTELDMKISNSEKGGIPVGKVVEIAGHEATGKSLLAMQIMANAQKMGGLCVYIDTEQGLNHDFAQRVGLDPFADNFLHIKSTTVENVFTLVHDIGVAVYEERKAAKKEKRKPEYEFVIFVWDSVAATYTKFDLTDENPDPGASVAVRPRILSKNLPFVVEQASKYDFSLVCVNQLRTIIGAQVGQDPYASIGGKAIPYYASVRIRIQSVGKLVDKKDNSVYGMKTKATVKKTRFGPPHRIAQFPIYFSYGIDDEESIVDVLSSEEKIISSRGGPKGTIYRFSDEEKEAGLNLVDFKNYIRTNPAAKAKARKLLSEALIKDMIDPREISLDVVTDEELSKQEE